MEEREKEEGRVKQKGLFPMKVFCINSEDGETWEIYYLCYCSNRKNYEVKKLLLMYFVVIERINAQSPKWKMLRF